MSDASPIQRRADWLDWRRQGIGGSDAPAVSGISPYSTALEVYLDKTGQLPDMGQSEEMEWGNRLETAVIEKFEDVTGYVVQSRQGRREHPDVSWMRATIDGVVAPAPEANALGLYEGKTSGIPQEWIAGPPAHVQVQVQHQLAVTKADLAFVAVLVQGQRFNYYELERDQDLIDGLMELEDAFWRRVQERRPPPARGTDSEVEAIRNAFSRPQTPSVSIELPEVARAQIEIRRAAAIAKKEAETRLKAADNALKVMLGDAAIGLLDGEPVLTWKGYETSTVDLDAMRARHPKLVARFTRSAPRRRIGFVGGDSDE